jgi:hypothetical protein
VADPILPGQDATVLLSTTLDNIDDQLIDNASENDAFFYWIMHNGLVDEEDGGLTIRKPVLHDVNNTIESYYPGEHYNTERPTGFREVKYQWGFVGGSIVIDGPTKFMNQGKHGIINIVDGYIMQFEISFSQYMTLMLLGDGTGNFGADLVGIDLLIEEGTAWSEVGGIDSDVYDFWRNYWADVSGTAWGTGANAWGLTSIKKMIRATSKPGFGTPDVLLTCLDQYELMDAAVSTDISVNLPETYAKEYADVGFGGFRILKVPVLYDVNLDGHATCDNTWFSLNKKSLRLIVGSGHRFKLGKPVPHPFMDAEIMTANFYGQLVVMGRRDVLGRQLHAVA